MALVLQAVLLVQGAPAAVAEAFIATRLGEEGGRSFGVLPAAADVATIVGGSRPEPGWRGRDGVADPRCLTLPSASGIAPAMKVRRAGGAAAPRRPA